MATYNVNGNMICLNLLYVATTTCIARWLMLHSNSLPLNSYQKPIHKCMATENFYTYSHGAKYPNHDTHAPFLVFNYFTEDLTVIVSIPN